MPVLLRGESKNTLSREDSIITSRTKALTNRTKKEGPNPRLNTFTNHTYNHAAAWWQQQED